MSLIRTIVLATSIVLTLPAAAAFAQGANIAFGAQTHDKTLPIEVSSDRLEVDQEDGSAVFIGNVVVAQGEMRLSAGMIRVEYTKAGADGAASGGIDRLVASEGVTLVSGAEAAEASEAVYSVADATVTMTGEVLLTQGQTAISGERLVVSLETGTGVMEGRVRTILNPGGN